MAQPSRIALHRFFCRYLDFNNRISNPIALLTSGNLLYSWYATSIPRSRGRLRLQSDSSLAGRKERSVVDP